MRLQRGLLDGLGTLINASPGSRDHRSAGLSESAGTRWPAGN